MDQPWRSYHLILCLPLSSPAGTFNQDAGLNITGCIPCVYGTISVAGSALCTPCTDLQANTYSSPDRTTCVDCPEGYYSTTYNIDPFTLPETQGYLNATGNLSLILPWPSPYQCHPCPNNTFRAAGEATCTNVSAGFVLRQLPLPVETAYNGTGGNNITDSLLTANATIANATDFLPLGFNDTDSLFIVGIGARRLLLPTADREELRGALRSMSLQELRDAFVTPRLRHEDRKRQRRLQQTGSELGEDPVYPVLQLLPCGKGFHSNLIGAAQCLPCPKGSYSDSVGANQLSFKGLPFYFHGWLMRWTLVS